MKTQIKRFLSMLLVFAMVLTLLPVQTYATPANDNVVINQVYGGGGNSGATFTHDFIELYNPTDSTISLDGWSVQYASASGSTWQVTSLSGNIEAKGFYLIQQAKGTGGTEALPTPDAEGNINMGGSNFKVTLVKNFTALTSSYEGAKTSDDPNIVDFVGAGTAKAYEGAVAPAPSNTQSIIRTNGVDTDDNSKDFITITPNPRNSSSSGGGTPVVTKVSAPTASQKPGEVNIGTEVTLSTVTSGAAIYYTADNSYPTTGSAIEYSVPIQITENVTIKAVAVDATGVLESSDVAVFNYTVITSAENPVPSYRSGASLQSGIRVKFTSATSGAVVKYKSAEEWVDVPVDGLEITGAVGTEVTYEVKATKEGLKDSATIKVTYTIKETSIIPDPVTDDMFIGKDININEAITTTSGDVSVIGQLAYRYGNYDNVNTSVIQDIINGEIVAIQTYNALDGFSIGDVVRIKGKAGAYGGVPQISSPTVELIKSADETVQIPAQEFENINNVISNKETLLSEVILLKDVTLGAYNSNGNTKIIDKNGNTLDIYRAATYPEGVTEGEVVDLLAILSKYTTTNQLRVGSSSANGGSQIYNVVNDTKAPVITIPSSYLDAQKGVEYKIEVDVTDNKGISKVTINYTIGDKDVVKEMTKNKATGRYEYTILAAEIVSGNASFTFTVEAEDVSGHKAKSTLTTIKISDAPRVVSVSPASGSSTYDNKKPEIYAMLENVGSAPTATLTLKNSNNHTILDAVTMTVSENKAAYTPVDTLADGKYTAVVVVTRQDSVKVEYTWTFTIGEPTYQTYFGQLHSHTAEYSDGSGTLKDGLGYIKNLKPEDNVHFVAFTDHSNYFDSSSSPNPEKALGDMSLATEESRAKWEKYTGDMRAFNAENNGVLAIPGFEMTWSGGPGHINTFNTNGIVSRNNKTLNNKSGDAGMQAYYELLKENTESISQFNHPGTTFGTFANFAYLDPQIDERISLIEVGNGEGAIGSSGHFPSHEYYIQALDKGWHLAPTNNQDNHKGMWGNSNDARTVIITEEFSEEGIYHGMRNMSVYSTEDKNLEIMYSINEQIMGSIISEVPEKINIQANISDPDNESIGTVEIVVNGGRVIHQEKVNASSTVIDLELSPEYSYYLLRVIQPDKDIAITAPVWVGEVAKVGITEVTTDTIMPVKAEKMDFKTKLYNYEDEDLVINKIEYSITHLGKTEVIKTVTEP